MTENAMPTDKPIGLEKPLTAVAFFCDAALTVEHTRVAAQVRLAHLARQGRTDQETEELLHRVQDLEKWVDDHLREWVAGHPTAAWWSGISGAYRELMGKVIGCIEAFGRYYPVGDPMIPPGVRREPVTDDEGRAWVWVEGIERVVTPSKLCKYAGLAPGARRQAGVKVGFNTQLRTMLFRLMTSFMRQTNRYYEEYVLYKSWKRAKLEAAGVRILPTPKGRYCAVCERDVATKAADYCPDCGEKLARKEEPEGVVWEGHLDFMARRRATKLFVCHLWAVWRGALGLPLRVPYAVEYGGHSTPTDPWAMRDREEPSGEKRATLPEGPRR